MLNAASVLAVNIPVGEHVTRKIGGITFNLDTIWTTAVACGHRPRSGLLPAVPRHVRSAREAAADLGVRDRQRVRSGRERPGSCLPRASFPWRSPSSCSSSSPTGWRSCPGCFTTLTTSRRPSADVNLTYALAFLVFILTTRAAFKAKGVGGYVRHLFRKPVVMFPLHIIEEIAKPVTLALRLFGNLFSGGIMIALLISFPIAFFPASIVFTVAWKLFDMFIGVIQAFIFALLTILYYQFAIEDEEGVEHASMPSDALAATLAQRSSHQTA